ncbi:MAG: APC family permease [Dehalococcoidia bacterium]
MKSGDSLPEPSTRDHLLKGDRPGDVFVQRHFKLPTRLHRVLGVGGLFSAAYGDVGSSIYYALGVVSMSALGLTPPVLMISGIIFLFTALTYAEGATMLPEAGGSGAFAKRAFNDWVSFIASWVLMMDYIVTMSISAFSAANYLGFFIPILKTWPTNSIVGMSIVGGLALINSLGLRESSRLNIVLVIIDVCTQVLVAILGLFLIINLPTLINNIHWGVAPTFDQLLFGISISMVAYTGIETVANLGSETKNPGKSIPRAVMLVFAVVILMYAFLSMTALSAYPVYQAPDGKWVTDLTQKFLEDPIMGIAYAMPGFIPYFLGFWVALLAATILIIATNAGMLGASRLAYFMGQRQQLPGFFGNISKKSHVPRNAILIFSVIAAALVSTGKVELLADLYAFGAVLAYTSAHASIIALRVKEPDLPRPFKIPLNIKIKDRDIPITAVLGGLATAITWLIVVYTHHIGRIVGFTWVGVGLLVYFLYRRYKSKQKKLQDADTLNRFKA